MRSRRILVALDGSDESRAALLAAAKLGVATHPGAELSGLFVEDVEYLRLANLPFAFEVGFVVPAPRPMNPADVKRRFRYAAAKARETLREVAEATALPSSFRVVRGRVAPELMAAAREADLVATGKRGGHGPARHRLGGTGRSLIAHLQAPVLVGGVQGRSPGPVVVICSTANVSEEALGFAALLARAFGAPDVVSIAGTGGTVPLQPATEASRIRRRFSSISPQSGMALPEAANASAVVLIRRDHAADRQLLVALAEAVTCPVFVVSPDGLARLFCE